MSKFSDAVNYLETAVKKAQAVLDTPTSTSSHEVLADVVAAAQDLIGAW